MPNPRFPSRQTFDTRNKKEKQMSAPKTGTIKFYNTAKGFGFVTPDGGGKDDFVHVTALKSSGIGLLKEGDRIEYDLVEHKGRYSAANLKKI
jgi:CspA family cold shock protein